MKSRSVSIGLTVSLALALAACGKDPEPETVADYHRICIDNNEFRVEDEKCPDDDSRGSFFHPVWVYGGYRAPAVGSKVTSGTFTQAKPASGTVARPPATGGFGTFRAGSGSVGG